MNFICSVQKRIFNSYIPHFLLLFGLLYCSYSLYSNHETDVLLEQVFIYTKVVRQNIVKSRSNLELMKLPVKPFQIASQDFQVVPEYNLAYCAIPEVMSSIMRSLVCYLYDSDDYFENQPITMADWMAVRPCRRRNEYNLFSRLGEVFPSFNFKGLVVVRDPFERFVSNYVTKCLVGSNMVRNETCFECPKNDLHCTIEQLGKTLMELTTNPTLQTKFDYEVSQLAPITWFCKMDTFYRNAFFVKHGIFGDDRIVMANKIASILTYLNIPVKKANFVAQSLKNENTWKHSANALFVKDEISAIIRSNRTLLTILNKIYYHDYLIFNYPLALAQ